MKTPNMIFAICVCVLAGNAVQAQTDRLTLNLGYSVKSPVGDFRNAVSNISWRGWEGSLMYNINEHVSAGLATGFQDFYQKYPRQVYKMSDGSDVSAVLTNSVQTVPILAMVKYNFSPAAVVQPFVGLGAGGNIVLYRQYLGEFGDSHSRFGFAARPEAGLFIPFRHQGPAGVELAGSYNFMPFKYYGLKNLDNWGASIGVKFPLK